MFKIGLAQMKWESNSGRIKVLGHNGDECVLRLSSLHHFINYIYGLAEHSYYLVCNGKKMDIIDDAKPPSGIVHIVPRILGGKGGFGSMLRAIGAQIEKTTNREACRDLSGRRLRDINEEQRLKNWIAQQADREREAAESKKKKLERLQLEPKHEFKDEKYDESRSLMAEKMSNSVEQGFKASTSGLKSSCTSSVKPSLKRKPESNESRPKKISRKKKKLWIDAEGSDSSLSESEESKELCDVKKLSLP